MTFDHSEIYSLAHYYDLVNDFDDDVEFFIEYALEKGGKTLELACGTGRLTIPLAKGGVDITGIDISDEMLSLAKEKAFKEGLNIDFQKQNIIDFELGEKFNFIFCVHSSFSHVDGFDNVNAFFANVLKHLADDGIFVLQVFNPDFFFFTRNPNEQFPLKTFEDPFTKNIVSLEESSFYDDETQIHYIKWHFHQEGKEEQVVSWTHRVYYPQELEYILMFCGFEIVDKFGDFDESDFENDSDTQILVLRKRM